MVKDADRNPNADELGSGFVQLAREAVASVPTVVVQTGGKDLVVLGKHRFEEDYRLTPQAYVRDNPVSQEAADLMDEVMAEARGTQPAPFGI